MILTFNDGVWSGSTILDAAGGHFTILNGNCADWSCKEDISGQSCADVGNYNDRNNLLGGFSQDTTLGSYYSKFQSQTSSSLTLTGIMDFSLSGSSGKSFDVNSKSKYFRFKCLWYWLCK